MSETLKQLQRRYDRPCLALEEVRQEYLPELGYEELLTEIHKGHIKLRYTRLRASRKSKPVVFLHDLATWLDSCNPSNNQTAANQAA